MFVSSVEQLAESVWRHGENTLTLFSFSAFFYGVVEALFVSIYCLGAWKAGWTKAPASAPIWRVLLLSYEVMEYEMKDLDAIEVSISESDSTEQELTNPEGNILTTYFNWTGMSHETEKGHVGKAPFVAFFIQL